MEGKDIPIEHLEGFKTTYEPNYYYSYPFEENFSHENYICVAVTRHENQYTGYKLIGFNIEFLKQIDRNTYKDRLNLRGFKCMGLALIETTEDESIAIIKDLKDNSNFYVEKASDLI